MRHGQPSGLKYAAHHLRDGRVLHEATCLRGWDVGRQPQPKIPWNLSWTEQGSNSKNQNAHLKQHWPIERDACVILVFLAATFLKKCKETGENALSTTIYFPVVHYIQGIIVSELI